MFPSKKKKVIDDGPTFYIIISLIFFISGWEKKKSFFFFCYLVNKLKKVGERKETERTFIKMSSKKKHSLCVCVRVCGGHRNLLPTKKNNYYQNHAHSTHTHTHKKKKTRAQTSNLRSEKHTSCVASGDFRPAFNYFYYAVARICCAGDSKKKIN